MPYIDLHNFITTKPTLEKFEAILPLFLENNGDINAIDGHGDTVLHIAARRGYDHLIAPLIHHDVDINRTNNGGETAVFLASQHNHPKTTEILAQQRMIRLSMPNQGGWTPLLIATFRGHENVVKVLLPFLMLDLYIEREGQDALGIACERGDETIASLLMHHGAGIGKHVARLPRGTNVTNAFAIGFVAESYQQLQGEMIQTTDQLIIFLDNHPKLESIVYKRMISQLEYRLRRDPRNQELKNSLFVLKSRMPGDLQAQCFRVIQNTPALLASLHELPRNVINQNQAALADRAQLLEGFRICINSLDNFQGSRARLKRRMEKLWRLSCFALPFLAFFPSIMLFGIYAMCTSFACDELIKYNNNGTVVNDKESENCYSQAYSEIPQPSLWEPCQLPAIITVIVLATLFICLFITNITTLFFTKQPDQWPTLAKLFNHFAEFYRDEINTLFDGHNVGLNAESRGAMALISRGQHNRITSEQLGALLQTMIELYQQQRTVTTNAPLDQPLPNILRLWNPKKPNQLRQPLRQVVVEAPGENEEERAPLLPAALPAAAAAGR